MKWRHYRNRIEIAECEVEYAESTKAAHNIAHAHDAVCDKYEKHIAALEAENQRLREALEGFKAQRGYDFCCDLLGKDVVEEICEELNKEPLPTPPQE